MLDRHSLKERVDLLVGPVIFRRCGFRKAAEGHGCRRDVLARSLEDGWLVNISHDATVHVPGVCLGSASISPDPNLTL